MLWKVADDGFDYCSHSVLGMLLIVEYPESFPATLQSNLPHKNVLQTSNLIRMIEALFQDRLYS
jgi:hypothetical protein